MTETATNEKSWFAMTPDKLRAAFVPLLQFIHQDTEPIESVTANPGDGSVIVETKYRTYRFTPRPYGDEFPPVGQELSRPREFGSGLNTFRNPGIGVLMAVDDLAHQLEFALRRAERAERELLDLKRRYAEESAHKVDKATDA